MPFKEKKPGRCYIAGPMTGVAEYNKPLFARAARDLRKDGWDAVDPHETFGGDTSLDWTTYMAADILLVLNCDAVVVLPGWQDVDAVGARMEMSVAIASGKTIYEYVPIDSSYRLVKWDNFDARKAVAYLMSGRNPAAGHVPEQKPQDILDKARGLIHGARQNDYAHPLDNFTRIADFWSVILGVPVTPEQHVQCMIAVKLARLINSPEHEDSIIDMAGYAGTYEMVLAERRRRQARPVEAGDGDNTNE